MRKYFFVSRYLSLVPKETKFKVVRDIFYEEIGASYEKALEKLIQRINIVEGTVGMISNNGFPIDLDPPQDRAEYCSKYFLFTCLSESQHLEFILPRLTNEGLLFSGFYADQELRLPRTLVISRIHIQEDVVDYIFYPEKGSYKGEYDCYFYLNGILYTAENLSPEWSFTLEETVIKEVKNEETYAFRGKLLCFYQSPKVMDDALPHCIVKLFRTDDSEFII